MTGVRQFADVHRQVCSVLCWARSDVSVLAQFLHYVHMWISRLGTHSWVVSWTLSQNHHVLYFISSHNGALTRCSAQTNPSYHISWHMWPGVIRVTSGSNDTDTVPVSIQSTLPEPVVTKPPIFIHTRTQLVSVISVTSVMSVNPWKL